MRIRFPGNVITAPRDWNSQSQSVLQKAATATLKLSCVTASLLYLAQSPFPLRHHVRRTSYRRVFVEKGQHGPVDECDFAAGAVLTQR